MTDQRFLSLKVPPDNGNSNTKSRFSEPFRGSAPMVGV